MECQFFNAMILELKLDHFSQLDSFLLKVLKIVALVLKNIQAFHLRFNLLHLLLSRILEIKLKG